MLVLAHRGASADAPENTLAAFAEAVRQRADGVELDAMVCGSGEVVVCHDPTLERLAGAPWSVAHTPWWKLRRADVGRALGHASAGIPLLTEVLAALPPHFVVNIELKCEEVEDRGLAVKVGALVTSLGLSGRVLVSSFNPLCLFRLAASHPSLRRGYLIDPDRPTWLHAGLLAALTSNSSIHPHESACTPRRVHAWRERGLRVAAWTVDDPARARQLQALGVSYCITNRPALIRRALEAEA